MIPVGGPTTASLHQPVGSLFEPPVRPVLEPPHAAMAGQPTGSVLDRPTTFPLDQPFPLETTDPGDDRTEPSHAESAKPSHAESANLDPIVLIAADGNPFSPVNSYPVPAWLVRQSAARTRTGKKIIALAAILLLALALLGVTVQLAMRGFATEPAADIVASAGPVLALAPPLAGGLPRHYPAERNPGTEIAIAQFRRRFAVVLNDATTPYTAGLYSQPGRVDVITGLPAWVMYFGVNVRTSAGDLPVSLSAMMASLAGPGANDRAWQVNAGSDGGTAQCVVTVIARTQLSICGWATDGTRGALMSPTRDTSVRELAVLMTLMRPDLQPG
jgi:hypothetical protein